MKSFMRNLILFTAIILSVPAFILNCREPEKEEEKVAEIPGYRQAMVTFLMGESFVLLEDNWEPLDICDFIVKEDIVKVAEDSYCELQFGNTAAIRIQENTVVEMKAIFLKSKETDIGLKLSAGSVLFKVGKLVGDEKFKVKTAATVLGVRATQFMVREEERGTLVAVKEGKVAVLPAAVDVDMLREKVGEENEKILELFDKLEEAARVIEAGQELMVEKEASIKAEADFRLLEELIDEVLELLPEISPETIEELNKRIDGVVQNVSVNIGLPKPVTEENFKALKEIEKIRMLEITPGEEAPSEQIPERPALVRIRVKVKPEDSDIFLNGEPIGKARMYGIFEQGERLSFLIKRDGYIEKSLDLTVEKDTHAEYEIELEEEAAVKRPEEKEVTLEPEEKPVEREEIGFKVEPPDSEILLNGELVGRGTFSEQFILEEKLSFLIRREDYEEKTLDLVVTKDSGKIYEITLELKAIVKKYSISNSPVIGDICTDGEKIISVDRDGVIFVSDFQEKVLQSLPTGNSPNENGFPVLIEDRVFLIGTNSFIVADINSGEVLKDLPVENGTVYPLGRRVVEFTNRGIFPDNDSINIFELSTGDVTGEIKVPNGSIMTPVVYKNRIFVVSRNGVLYIFDEAGETVSGIPITINTAFRDAAIASMIYTQLAFFAESSGTVICYDLEEKNVLWEKNFSEDLQIVDLRDLECGKEGLYTVSGGILYALSIQTGEALFEPISGLSSPLMYNEGKLYCGTADGRFRIYDAGTGVVIKSLDIQENITTKPSFVDGRVLVGTETGNIIFINPAGIK